MKNKKAIIALICAVLACMLFFAVQQQNTTTVTPQEDQQVAVQSDVDYSNQENWAYYAIGDEKDVDLFLVAPTTYTKEEKNMPLDDEKAKRNFSGALNMEKGIYEENTRMFAPYYKQIALSVYELDTDAREEYLEIAYSDVSAAFHYYLENENNGRPIILAGFSQGADMCYRLLEEYFGDKDLQDQLVAVYGFGWPVTDDMIEKYPQIKPAQAEDDIGVVVSFDCEAEDITDTIIVPEGTKTYSINPLNWKTDSTPADKELNLGACFTSYDGSITQEIPNLCGCYIDEERGTLKVPDVSPETYPAVLTIFPEGAYHIYDYQFFYRNLQENVNTRIAAYQANH